MRRFSITMHKQTLILLLASTSATLATAQQYSISTIAGGAPPATPATAGSAAIGVPGRVAIDAGGNVYFSASNAVFRLAANGTLTLVAGNSRPGFSGDGGPAIGAQLNSPQGLAFDSAGNLYIADSLNHRIRIVTPGGVINTFAGIGASGFGGGPRSFNDGGPANQAILKTPKGVAVGKSGNVFIADTGNNLIRIVTTDGIINTFAGDSYPGYYVNPDENALFAEFNKPSDVAIDSNGYVYVADTGNNVIRQVPPDSSTVTTFAGTANAGFAGDNGPATKADMNAPMSIAFDGSGNLFILQNADGRIRKVDTKANITTVAGSGTPGFADGSDATKAQFNYPTGLAIDGSGNIYIADSLNLRIRKIAGSTVSSIAGNGVLSYSGDNGPALAAQLNAPQGVAADASGNIYIADTANHAVRKFAKGGVITNVIGNGQPGSGNNQLSSPAGVAADASGNVYIADTFNGRVLKVGVGGVTPLASNDQLYTPVGIAVDSAGNVYVADLSRNMVRKLAASGGITTLAGNGNAGYSGDNGPAANALLNSPRGVAVDGSGNVYIADTGNFRIRKVTADGNISTIAGNGVFGYSGDAGQAVNAQIGNVSSLAVDAAGNIYFTDGTRLRKIVSAGLITTIAGNTPAGYSGDGGPSAAAQINAPAGIAVDNTGALYLADSGNNAIRQLQPLAGNFGISAVASAASLQSGVIAPGELIVLFGSGMGPAGLVQAQLNSAGVVGTSLVGTSVYLNGAAAPVLYTSANQVAVVAPFNLAGPKADVIVTYQGQISAVLTVSVAATAPALFTLNGSGTGAAVAVNADGSVNDAAHPAKAGTTVSIYATGGGQTNPPSQDGAPGAVPLPRPVAPVSLTIGGKAATVQYAGAAVGLISGALQINAQIPDGLSGAVPVVLQIGGSSSPNGITIYTSN